MAPPSRASSTPSIDAPPPDITTSPAPSVRPPRLANLPQRLGRTVRRVVSQNAGICILLLAQLFASLMALTTRYLATSLPSRRRFHALQILFVRMGITVVFSFAWMWYRKIAHAPFGPREVRPLLVARGLGGFVGVFGLYYSLSWLPLPDATVITFLAPTVVSFACSVIPALNEPFTLVERAAGLVSLCGVVLIARPSFLFPSPADTIVGHAPPVSEQQRALAVSVALLGVFGAATAYTTIRWIGTRAHPLLSVTYFSGTTTAFSLFGLLCIPSVGGIVLPHGALEWGLLAAIGVSGFVMQWLLTLGLQMEKAGRAGMMVYTQLVFSIVFEFVVWGDVPAPLSLVGCGLIVGSAVAVNVWKGVGERREARGDADEERALLAEEAVEAAEGERMK